MYRLFIDSNTGIDVYPEYNYREKDAKIENRFRSKSGKEYTYKFGDYRQWQFDVKYVNSSFKFFVNTCWNSNADLLWMETDGTEVFSVHITNRNKPIDRVIRPYTDLFLGKIELGEY